MFTLDGRACARRLRAIRNDSPHAMSQGAHVGDAVGTNVSAPAMPARRTTRSAAAAPDHAVAVMRR
jgi:hypothetical protein